MFRLNASVFIQGERLKHSVEMSARFFQSQIWNQRTLFSIYAGANWEATTL